MHGLPDDTCTRSRDRPGGGSEKSCQSLFADQVKELDSCSTPQQKVLIIPSDSSAVTVLPAELLGLSWVGGSAKQQMAAAAPRAVRPPPPQLTMVEPEGRGGSAATTLAEIFIYSNEGRSPRSESERAASRLRRKQVPPLSRQTYEKDPGVLAVHRR